MRPYPYVSDLTQAEFAALIGIHRRHGINSLLGAALDFARFKIQSQESSPADKAKAERVARELEAFIERQDGFEELQSEAEILAGNEKQPSDLHPDRDPARPPAQAGRRHR